MTRDDLLNVYFHLTREVLPTRARHEGWVVTADHCFQRIVLDNVVGDAWRNRLMGKGPAYRQLSHEQLERAVQLTTQIEQEGDALLRELNRKSLLWRGKIVGSPTD